MKKIILIGLLLLLITTAFAERKALVMANWTYLNASLASPKADADTISTILTSLGFSVTRINNLSMAEFKAAIDTFAVKTKATDEVLVYYSGHGVSYNNINYLLPSGTDLSKSQIFSKTAFSVPDIAQKLKHAKTSMLVLEASRTFILSGTKTTNNFSFAAMTPASPNQLILMSAEPGKTIQNSTLNRSLFTTALVRYLATSEIGINAFFPALSAEIQKNSNNLQKPYKAGNLQTDFIFNTNEIRGRWKNISPMEMEGGGSISW